MRPLGDAFRSVADKPEADNYMGAIRISGLLALYQDGWYFGVHLNTLLNTLLKIYIPATTHGYIPKMRKDTCPPLTAHVTKKYMTLL